MEDLSNNIADVIMEKPISFKIGGEYFSIYPLTLGKMYLMERATKEFEINKENIKVNLNLELLRVIKEHRDCVCDLMAYMTAKNEYYAVFDMPSFEKRKELLMGQEDDDLASLLLMVLTLDKTETYKHFLGIDKEQKEMSKVIKVKNNEDNNSLSFGGVSVFGSLIDVAMERYKMTKRQVVWEIDIISLRLLLSDRVNTLYLTDKERKKVHVAKDRTKVNGDDKDTVMKIIQSESWE